MSFFVLERMCYHYVMYDLKACRNLAADLVRLSLDDLTGPDSDQVRSWLASSPIAEIMLAYADIVGRQDVVGLIERLTSAHEAKREP